MTRPSVKLSALRVVVSAAALYGIFSLVGEKLAAPVESSPLSTGESWPTVLPEEANRVFSLNGLSLVAPEGWTAEMLPDAVRIVSDERKSIKSEISVREVINRYRHPVPLPENGKFQEQSAFISIQHVRTTDYEPVTHIGRIVFERDEKMYEMHFRSSRYFTQRIPQMIKIYLETFQIRKPELRTASLE